MRVHVGEIEDIRRMVLSMERLWTSSHEEIPIEIVEVEQQQKQFMASNESN